MIEFDKVINRQNTYCEKYDGLKEKFGYSDLQPLWVADMDFRTPDFINNAIKKQVNISLYGYPYIDASFFDAVISWQKYKNNLKCKKEDIFFTNGVVPTYSACIEAFSNINDEILVPIPIYPPLKNLVLQNNRKLITTNLKNEDGYYKFDFKDIESKITSKTKIFVLCNPHNPIGRVWDKEELEQLAKMCIKHKLIIISDEIHSDFSFKKFTPISTLSQETSKITVTLNSPGKTFNISALNSAYAITTDLILRKKLKRVLSKRGINHPNILGLIALKAAYENGQNYVKELNSYIKNNIDYVHTYIKTNNLPIEVTKTEATYLLWIDFSLMNLTHKEIEKKLLQDAKIALNNGLEFDSTANNFFRLNVALPLQELQKALEKINTYFKKG